MIVLGLDTATKVGGIAILKDGEIVVEIAHDMAGRTNDLLVQIDKACRSAGVTPMQLDAIAVGAGPGSFTGLRIGMATGKGIAFATMKPLWAVSSLAALASLGTAAIRVAALDARKGEVYAGIYRADGTAIGVEAVMHPSELAGWVTATLVENAGGHGGPPHESDVNAVEYLGDAAKTFGELEALGFVYAVPSGVAVARCALAGARVDVLVDGKPAYVRPAEAEVMYPDGVPGALRRR